MELANSKDYDFVTDIKAIEYIKSFNPRKKIINFKEEIFIQHLLKNQLT